MAVFGNLHLCLLIVGGLLVVNVQAYPRILDPSRQSEIAPLAVDKKFDVLILTQQWPQTVCFAFQNKGASDLCKSLNDNRWTIHGLWPTRLHTRKPAYCDNSASFNVAAIASMEKELNEKWPSLDKNKSSRTFWTHEWKKHGTCSTVLAPVNSQAKYFKKTMELRDTFYMKDLLEKVKILPGRSYPVQGIVNAISQVLGKRCVVSYICDPATKESYLSEIQICFDRSFNLIDCEGNIQYPKACSPTANVIYPARPRTVYG